MLRCSDGSLFATVTSKSPGECVSEHNAGRGQPYTKGRRPVALVMALDAGDDRMEARETVWAIRDLTRQGKEQFCDECPNTIERVRRQAAQFAAARRQNERK